jgi:hypothetical protein
VKKYEIKLKVNKKGIELSGFPRDFVTRTLAGSATSLRGVDEVESLELSLRFGKVKLSVNEINIELIQFPTLILANTLIGMVKSLNGVDGDVIAVDLTMKEVRS